MDKLLTGRRMLVVEDEILILLTIEDMLGDLGCKSVTAASTLDKAIGLIGGQAFDAAMLDMNLKGKSSRPVAETLVAHGVPFIVCTGNSGDVWDGFRNHAILRKPFDETALVALLTRLLPREKNDVTDHAHASPTV
jgi:DNA-binding response OmpR family regulator